MAKRTTPINLFSLAFVYFCIGAFTTFVGPFYADLTSHYKSMWGLIIGAFYLSFFIVFALFSYPAALIIDKIGLKKGMLLGLSIMMVGGLGWYILLKNEHYQVNQHYALMDLVAYCGALFTIAVGVVIAFVSVDFTTLFLDGTRKTSRITLMQCGHGLGAGLTPVLFHHILFTRNRTQASIAAHLHLSAPFFLYGIVILIACCIAIAISSLPQKITTLEQKEQVTKKSKLFYLAWFGIFLGVGTNFMLDAMVIPGHRHILYQGYAATHTTYFLATYWIIFFTGSLVGSRVIKYVNSALYLCICMLLAFILFIAAYQMPPIIQLCIMLSLGFFTSMIFPVLYSSCIYHFGKPSIRASGLIATALCGPGLMTIITASMDRHLYSVFDRPSEIFCAVFYLCVSIIAAVLYRKYRQNLQLAKTMAES